MLISHATQNLFFQTPGQKGKTQKKRNAFLATQEHQNLPGLPQNEKAYWFKHKENTPCAGPSGATAQHRVFYS